MSNRVLLLRTCAADGASHGGFRWPLEVGAEVVAPDWNPAPECGGGLHGLLWGEGDGSLLSWDSTALWMVISAPAETVVDLSGKVKVPSARVEFVGDRIAATAYLASHGAAGRAIVGGTATAGNRGTATAGYRGTATAGYRGTATAGNGGTATAGYEGTATAGYRGTATAGNGGTATAGYEGTATAGYEGEIRIRWWDRRRYRLAVGYVGEDGILPGVAYRVVDGKLTPAGEGGMNAD